MTNSWLTQLEKLFWPNGFKRDVWMIADAARDPQILPTLAECHMQSYCLYSGDLSPPLRAAAPYLVELDYDDRDTRRFLTQAWGNSWGVFLKCGAHPNAVLQHLREILVVSEPYGKCLLFRYYDPRVLKIFLPTCHLDELRSVFGPIEHFWVEDEERSVILNYHVDDTGLQYSERSLDRRSLQD